MCGAHIIYETETIEEIDLGGIIMDKETIMISASISNAKNTIYIQIANVLGININNENKQGITLPTRQLNLKKDFDNTCLYSLKERLKMCLLNE